MAKQLLPCPFCGGKRIQADVYIRDGRGVTCLQCGASVPAFNPNGNQKAVAKWNTRVPTVNERLLDALRGIRIGFDLEASDGPVWLAYIPINGGSDAAVTIGEKNEQLRAAIAQAEASNG